MCTVFHGIPIFIYKILCIMEREVFFFSDTRFFFKAAVEKTRSKSILINMMIVAL